MNKDDEIRLWHMLDAAKEASGFVSGKERENLDTNRMLVLALVKDIEIIGEAASKVSEECRQQHSQIPWRDITDMRNYLIHAYFKVDLDIVWSTVQDDLLPLIAEREKLVPHE